MLHPHLEVKNTGVISGLGLVANGPISAGELIWEPNPAFPLVNRKQLLALRQSGNTDYYSQVSTDMYARNSTKEYCMNHSCGPNCYLESGRLYAFRDIPIGEEITYDYSLTESNLNFRFHCEFKSKFCRVVVTNMDYLDPELMTRASAWATEHARVAAESATERDRAFYVLFRRGLLLKSMGAAHPGNSCEDERPS